MLSITWYPCSARKYPYHMISDISSPIPKSSDSVELFAFNFFVEFDLAAPWPMSIIVPVWLFMSWCTPNVASTYQQRVFVPTIPIMRGRPMVDQMYFMNWFRLFQSSFFGSFTLVQNKMTPKYRFGLTLLCRYNRFDVTWWNLMVSSSIRLSGWFLLVVHKWSPFSVSNSYAFMYSGSSLIISPM